MIREEGKSKGKRSAEDGTNCITLVPYSADAKYDRKKSEYHLGRGLGDMALPLERLYFTAERKEQWWKDEMLRLLMPD